MNSDPNDQPDPPCDLDQEICLCFHVTRRKVENFIRIEQPRRAAQLSECFGAGTGCGYCRRWLIALFEASRDTLQPAPEIPSPDQYRLQRRAWHRKTGWSGDE